MDLALGTPYMQVFLKGGRLLGEGVGRWIENLTSKPRSISLLGTLLCFASVFAQIEKDPMHWSGDRTVWDRKNNFVELFGHAAVHQPGKSLSGDYIRLDLNTRTIDARGNVLYFASGTIIQGDELHFNMDTTSGNVVNGRVTDGHFLLMGERINKLGEKRFLVHDGEYTTCVDCPGSWSLMAKDVDMEVEEYAHMSNVTGKIKDTPFFWSPYLLIPVKTKRQTGFLFPKFGFSDDRGFGFLQPFFWATSRSTDMTIGAGTYTERGLRLEWEGRYAMAEKSEGIANVYYQRDSKALLDSALNQRVPPDRWAGRLAQRHAFPWHIDQKLLVLESSDNQYPVDFGDIPGRGEPVLESVASVSRSTSSLSAFVEARRHRNLLNLQSRREFDPNTVQLVPRALVTTNDQFLLGSPVAGGLSLGVSRFTRDGDFFDTDLCGTRAAPKFCEKPPGQTFHPGLDPVRKATRASVTPSLYTTVRPFDVISVVPSVEYRSFFYNFDDKIPDLSRGYLLAQTEMSLQFEKVYDHDDPEIPRFKHLVRPRLKYSFIPYQDQPKSHAFIKQTERMDGYQFDNYDLVPYTQTPSLVNYFVPLGHSLDYGFKTQLIRRRSPKGVRYATYQSVAELNAGQAVNFLEFRQPHSKRVPLTRFYSSLGMNFDQIQISSQYFYYAYLDHLVRNLNPGLEFNQQDFDRNYSPHEVSAHVTYFLEKTFHQEILEFERSITLGYNYKKLGKRDSGIAGGIVYSLSDYIMPSITTSYDFNVRKFVDTVGKVVFQSPARCWKITLSAARAIDRPGVWQYSFDLALNLTGSGFGGVSEVADKVATN